MTTKNTKVGSVNDNKQVTIRNTGKRGNHRFEKVYQLGCSLCGCVYGANGADIFERKCPCCQNGKPGTPFISQIKIEVKPQKIPVVS